MTVDTARLHRTFVEAKPFPHVVIENFPEPAEAQTIANDLGRCLIFEASDISFHGVSPLKCPDHVARRSFAAYYYTHERPPAGIRNVHGTVFRARPDAQLRELVLMPADQAQRALVETVKIVRRRARRLASRVIRGH